MYTVEITLEDGIILQTQANGEFARRSLYLGAEDWLDNNELASSAVSWKMFKNGVEVNWGMYDA